MPLRKEPIVTDNFYHIFTKSIAGFKIFNNKEEYQRMYESISYYRYLIHPGKFSHFIGKEKEIMRSNTKKRIDIIAYCLMPTHIHLILRQKAKNGITEFMANILSSYTHFFNLKHNRKGPLWEGRFKNVLIESDEQLLHLTRYIHLNPVTAYLVEGPEKWEMSSYKEYIDLYGSSRKVDRICYYKNVIDMESERYKKFVENARAYQRERAVIKHLILE